MGLGPVEIIEIEPRKSARGTDSEALLGRMDDAYLIACDERGEAIASRDLADIVVRLRDDGVRRLVFAVGGADGLDQAVRSRADRLMAFGPQTWPHALARAMLAEQVYRAATLIAGTPYHRQ